MFSTEWQLMADIEYRHSTLRIIREFCRTRMEQPLVSVERNMQITVSCQSYCFVCARRNATFCWFASVMVNLENLYLLVSYLHKSYYRHTNWKFRFYLLFSIVSKFIQSLHDGHETLFSQRSASEILSLRILKGLPSQIVPLDFQALFSR